MREVAVIGLGYVGLTMAACLAARGIRTTGVDVDKQKMAMLRKGISPFYEPGLQDVLSESLRTGHLALTTDYGEAVERSELTFVTVGTPSNPDGSIDLDQIRAVCTSMGPALRGSSRYHLTIIRSTVAPGTTEKVVKPLLESSSGMACGSEFGLCVNPEFISEGRAVDGTMNPDRIVIGEWDSQAGDILENFYVSFCDREMPPVVRTTLANAELIKYANNAFLATKVSFINSLASLCEQIPGADVELIAKGIGLDPRIGHLFLKAGLGWGGSCFPKDVKALLRFAESAGVELPVIDASMRVNDAQPMRAIELARNIIGSLKGRTIAILGLSFKPETDDIREATALKIVGKLLGEGAEVVVYDPKAMQNAKNTLGDRVRYAETVDECVEKTDCCIVATEWNEFKEVRAEQFVKKMRVPAIVDGRRIYNPSEFKSKLKYAAVGLGK